MYLCLWREWHRSGMVFLVNILLIQPGKNPKKINTHPWPKLYKSIRIPFSNCHTCPLPLLWHEFHWQLYLCNFLQSKVSRCLHMYFLWRHHLPPDKSENDQDSDSDWFTYCIDIRLLTLALLYSLQYFSESWFGNDNNFITQPMSCFVFIYQTFYSWSLILFTQPLSLWCQPPP